MDIPVAGQGIVEEVFGVFRRQVRLAVLLGYLRGSSSHDDAFPALVEDLGDARHDARQVERLEKAYADEADGELSRIPDETPRDTACLVIQGGVKVPRPRGFVLKLFHVPRSRFFFLLAPLS